MFSLQYSKYFYDILNMYWNLKLNGNPPLYHIYMISAALISYIGHLYAVSSFWWVLFGKISKKLSRVATAVLENYYMGAYGQISYQSLESGEWGATKIE